LKKEATEQILQEHRRTLEMGEKEFQKHGPVFFCTFGTEKPVMVIMMMTIIQFNSLFINVLYSTADGQLQGQHKYKQQQ
jgi:hypothetical protein